VSLTEILWLTLAGVGAGLTGSMAGLASLVSYPALLAAGLPPYVANVTNTVGLLPNGFGSALSSRTELRGQGRRVARLAVASATGGVAGAALLLLTDPAAFEAVVPWLVALGAVLLLTRDKIREAVERRRSLRTAPAADPRPWRWTLVVVLAGVYGGYFGAGAGIIVLAVLSLQTVEPIAVSNAVKNIVTTACNAVAAAAYVVLAPVEWAAAAPLAVGVMVGAVIGPALVRRVPERPFRWGVGLAGLGLAGYLLVS